MLSAKIKIYFNDNPNWDFSRWKSKLRSVLARINILPAGIAIWMWTHTHTHTHTHTYTHTHTHTQSTAVRYKQLVIFTLHHHNSRYIWYVPPTPISLSNHSQYFWLCYSYVTKGTLPERETEREPTVCYMRCIIYHMEHLTQWVYSIYYTKRIHLSSTNVTVYF